MMYEADYTENNIIGWDEDNELPANFYEEMPQPLYWRVIVMPVKPKEVSKGGIVLPQTTQEAQQYLTYIGKIVAVGSLAFKDQRLRDEEKIPKVGDYVIYGRYAGQVILYKEVRLLCVNDDEILAVVKNPESLKIHV